jgi:hypothetical protein
VNRSKSRQILAKQATAVEAECEEATAVLMMERPVLARESNTTVAVKGVQTPQRNENEQNGFCDTDQP